MARLIYSRLTVRKRAKDDAVLGLLSLHGPLGFVEEGRDLVACFREAAAARGAGDALAQASVEFELTTDIPEGDPLEAFRAASRPFAVGRRFWLDPGDPSDSAPPAGRIALRVPASRAFGTGGHESTRLALAALEDEPLEGARVLDAGTGSGVLALAAAALGARQAVGYDTDADAVFVARDNLGRHPFGSRVSLFAGKTEALRAGSMSLSPTCCRKSSCRSLRRCAGAWRREGGGSSRVCRRSARPRLPGGSFHGGFP